MNQILKLMFFILFFSGVSRKAQTYIQGKYAIRFNTIDSTPALQNSTLLSIEQAYSKIIPFFNHRSFFYYSKIKNYSGEFLKKNNLVTNIK